MDYLLFYDLSTVFQPYNDVDEIFYKQLTFAFRFKKKLLERSLIQRRISCMLEKRSRISFF